MKTKKAPNISEDKILCSYRPHMFLIAVLPVVGLSIILFSSASIVLLLNLVETGMPTIEQLVKGIFTFCLALTSVFAFILFGKMYDICIICTQEGIYVINDKKMEPSLKTWHSLGYAYYTKNIQGHCFIVLSPTPIDKAVIKQQMRKQFFSSSLLVGETIIFEENASRSAKQMTEIVMHHMRVR